MNPAGALARISSLDLPGVRFEPICVDSFAELLDLADSQRMVPWISAAVSQDLINGVAPQDRSETNNRALTAIQTTLAAHAATASVISRLADVDVADVRVLKGCATGYLDYAAVGRRFSSDVDLLIRPEDYDAAIAAFPETNVPVPRRANFQRRYGKATTVRDGRVEIDLHTMLTHGFFGLVVPIEELMRHKERFEIGGVEMFALDRPGRLLHAANHVWASEHVGMHSARDVPQIALSDDTTWQEAIDRARRWHVDGLFALGVMKAWQMFDIDGHPLVDWARRHRPDARQRLALKLMGNRAHGPQLTGPLALPPHRWPGYVGPFLFPSRKFLVQRGEGRRALTARIAREIRAR